LHAMPSAGKKGTGKLNAIIGGSVLALTLIGGGIYFVVIKGGNKKKRIKCVNNLGNIGKALTGFADANAQRAPWQLTPLGQINHKYHGASSGGFKPINNPGVGMGSAAQIVNIAAMRSELQTPKILVSPSDPDRAAANERLQANWKTASEVDIEAGLSYAFALGGDVQRPGTVLALTKNIRSDLNSDWTGADESPPHPHSFARLNKSQGQLVLADGSAKQSSNADLGMNGKITKGHISSRGGQSRKNAITTILR
jgi:hypothetical protein